MLSPTQIQASGHDLIAVSIAGRFELGRWLMDRDEYSSPDAVAIMDWTQFADLSVWHLDRGALEEDAGHRSPAKAAWNCCVACQLRASKSRSRTSRLQQSAQMP